MTWARTKQHGSGVVGYRLMIEGWPDVWTTDPRITWNATSLDGRNIYAGLLTEGLEIRERALLRDGGLEVSGQTFRIRSVSANDEAVSSFTRHPKPVEDLGADIDEAVNNLTLVSGGTLTTGSYYHIGTEAIKSISGNSITRTRWGTLKQKHSVTYDGADITAPIYDFPPSMEGRRCYLYAYGDGDTMSADGNLIWRGIVSRPAMPDSDGVTWMIQADSIVSVLDQKVAAQDRRYKPRGVYHSKWSAFYMKIVYNDSGGGGTQKSEFRITGLYEDFDAFVKAVNDQIATELAAFPVGTDIDFIKVTNDNQGLRMITEIGSAVPDLIKIVAGSNLIGWLTGHDWVDEDTGVPTEPGSVLPNHTYSAQFTFNYDWWTHAGDRFRVTSWLGNSWGAEPFKTIDGKLMRADTAASDDEHPWRIYVDRAMTDVSVGDYLYIGSPIINGPRGPGFAAETDDQRTFKVADIGDMSTAAEQWVELDPDGIHTAGAINEDTEIVRLFSYSELGDVGDFIAGLSSESINANEGETPFVVLESSTPATVNQGDFVDMSPGKGLTAFESNRKYVFSKSASLREILAEELKLIGHMWRLTASGAMDIIPLPFVSGTETASDTITSTDIVTPGDDQGAWATWEPQSEGIVNEVTVKTQYDHLNEEHRFELIARDIDSIASRKVRGKSEMEIAPLSNPANFGDPHVDTELYDRLLLVAEVWLDFLGSDYSLVEVKVPYTKFDILLGDIVALTDSRVPDGNGNRGVSSKRGFVVSRHWPLDASVGTLGILVRQSENGGYTPSARITAQSGSGTDWTLTTDNTNAFNVAWKQDADTHVLAHFSVGDYIRLEQVDDDNETVVTGTVDTAPDTSADTIGVATDSTWTPGSNTWNLIWDHDDGSTATSNQRGYTYVADSGLKRADSTNATRFA